MTSLISSLLSLFFKQKTCVRKNKHNLPLPKVCHKEIPDSVIGDRAVFVIGDVHGCLEEMCELMEKARSIEEDTLFVLVGDLTNKGPFSVGVVRKLREMGTDAYAVRGNHDESVLNQVRSHRSDPNYELSKKYDWIKELSDDDVDYLSSLPYTISIPRLKAIMVHGGIVPGKPLEKQKLNDLTNMRNVIDTGDAFESDGLIGYNKLDKGVAWVDTWPGPEHVYFGHDARRMLQRARFATGLDTGCCYGSELTGVFVNKTRQFLSVKSKQKFSFDEE